MAHIIIDGYNYVMRTTGARTLDGSSLDIMRRGVLDKLARYKRRSGARVTVVFDAYRSLSPDRQRENHLGIDVVYSRENETADDVIIGWIRSGRPGMVVVTSDRAIIDEAKGAGVAFIVPQRLEEMMKGAVMSDQGKGSDDDDNEPATTKKGNARKLPKKLRKASKTILKIR